MKNLIKEAEIRIQNRRDKLLLEYNNKIISEITYLIFKDKIKEILIESDVYVVYLTKFFNDCYLLIESNKSSYYFFNQSYLLNKDNKKEQVNLLIQLYEK